MFICYINVSNSIVCFTLLGCAFLFVRNPTKKKHLHFLFLDGHFLGNGEVVFHVWITTFLERNTSWKEWSCWCVLGFKMNLFVSSNGLTFWSALKVKLLELLLFIHQQSGGKVFDGQEKSKKSQFFARFLFS